MKLLLNSRTQRQIDGLVRSPGGSVLFHGPTGLGKTTTAREVARLINCEGCEGQSCRSCAMLGADTHPDVVTVVPDAKSKIGIEQIHDINQKLQYSQYNSRHNRVVIIDNADSMTLPAQNALLKLLEEPPAGTTMILTAESPVSLLGTIVSRCRPVYFGPITREEILKLPELNGVDAGEAEILITESRLRPAELIKSLSQPADTGLAQVSEDVRTLSSSPNLFDRLKVAAGLAKMSDRIKMISEMIEVETRRLSRERPETAHNLVALNHLKRRLAANVNPKVALEAFAVEAVC